jgi:atypical dual specificity phosphatase
VHCGGGKGRAGTVAACYIAAFGFQKLSFERTQPAFPAAEAMALLRSLRPGSIETSHQEEFVSKWCSTIWKRRSIFPDRPTEPPPCAAVVEGSLNKENDLFVLMGLPGSGKSSFCKSLMARDPGGWNCISQDDSGSRLACEAEIGRKPNGRVLLDRCNTAPSDRKGWLELASNWCTSPVCVWFDYDRDLCISRAQLRAGHPTLPPGNRVRNAVEQMSKIFARPTLREGFKAIVIIQSFAAAQEFVLRLSPPITVYKFPRTPHLLDLGAATSDDIHTDVSSLKIEGHVVITEKIDGANMGFSLSSDRSQIVVQNRSHYVNSSTHEQFKKLGLWVERHREELYQLLDRDPYFAERYILFGEWVFATHSIPYTHLPDYFIAYDLYDRATQTWEHTQGLRRLLSSTTISVVPIIHEGTLPADDDLRGMVQSKSSFYDGRVEGVYVKVERDTQVAFRGKIVRDDFIAGNEHWTRGGLRVNGLDKKL